MIHRLKQLFGFMLTPGALIPTVGVILVFSFGGLVGMIQPKLGIGIVILLLFGGMAFSLGQNVEVNTNA